MLQKLRSSHFVLHTLLENVCIIQYYKVRSEKLFSKFQIIQYLNYSILIESFYFASHGIPKVWKSFKKMPHKFRSVLMGISMYGSIDQWAVQWVGICLGRWTSRSMGWWVDRPKMDGSIMGPWVGWWILQWTSRWETRWLGRRPDGWADESLL